MTRREFFQAVADNNITEEIREYALNAIDKLDAQNIKRKDKPTKVQIENAALIDKMVEMFAGQSKLFAHTIAEKMDITTSKASALCRMAAKDGRVTVTDEVDNKTVKKAYSFE